MLTPPLRYYFYNKDEMQAMHKGPKHSGEDSNTDGSRAGRGGGAGISAHSYHSDRPQAWILEPAVQGQFSEHEAFVRWQRGAPDRSRAEPLRTSRQPCQGHDDGRILLLPAGRDLSELRQCKVGNIFRECSPYTHHQVGKHCHSRASMD